MKAINKVFIGFDPRQTISYTVLAHSIATRSSSPISITPLILEQLPIARCGLTPFTYSRFLVPYLCDYDGWALFLDADMLLNDDISKLFNMADDRYSVMVAKNEKKFEWASAILFNCSKCKILTPEYIETADRMHVFDWLDSADIGCLPPEWNYLVGYDKGIENPSLIHFTQGVPIFKETECSEFSEKWIRSAKESMFYMSWPELMGRSVHAVELPDGTKVPRFVAQRMVDSGEVRYS